MAHLHLPRHPGVRKRTKGEKMPMREKCWNCEEQRSKDKTDCPSCGAPNI